MLIELPEQDLPLCPNSGHPAHPAHRQANEHGDRLYAAAEPCRDDDGEYPDPRVAAIMQNAYPTDHMRLFEDSANAGAAGIRAGVWSYAAYYFRCDVCGLILPCQPQMMPARP